MNYELAKQLKDAGYCPKGCQVDDWEEFEHMRPTLEELIEACGDGFEALRHDRSMKNPDNEEWAADRKWYRPIFETYVGRTPTEAVARLWLALNKKS